LFCIGLYTSFRLGDAVTLRWDEVKLSTNRIIRDPSKTIARTGEAVVIPIHPALYNILSETPKQNRREYVLPEFSQIYLSSRSKISRMIQKHFQVCGIQTTRDKVYKQSTCVVGFHSLRHSFVTICAKKGVAQNKIEELCGHRSDIVHKAYLHFGERETKDAILALPDISSNAFKALDEKKIRLPVQSVIELLRSQTAENWQEMRDKAIGILNS